MIWVSTFSDFWNVDYSPTDGRRLELDEERVAEAMMTYWLLEMSQRFDLYYVLQAILILKCRYGIKIPLTDAEFGIEQAILSTVNIFR